MYKKLSFINKAICSLLFALCFLFAACEDPKIEDPDNPIVPKPPLVDDPYNNPNSGASRALVFSHNSGLYAQPFSLTLTVGVEGSSVYYTTDGSIPSPGKEGTIQYTAPINVVNRNGQANVLATEENNIQMYMDPDDSRGNVPLVYQPTVAQVPKATVIRAIAVNASGVKSDVLTKTYFIGDNLSQYGGNRVVSLVSDPYNLVDTDYGIMVRGNPANRWETNPPYNFRQKGEDWERPAYLELFEGNASSRSVALSEGVGIRVRGAYSRGPGQKSFTVYFKEQYGIKNLKNYNLIPGAVKADGETPVETYKSVMLRSGANDSEYTKFYDVFLQELLSDRSFSTQAGVPCIVYLNGEYWGPYNLQERYSDNHTEYKYGVDKDNVISYDNGELDDGFASEESLFPNLAEGVISGSITYDQFCEKFDIDNFIDYWAAEIYIYNEDWPQNNYRLWRTRTVEPGNPYGDTKWRYQMFDTEFALGIYSDGRLTGQANVDAFAKILTGEHNGHVNNRLFAKLITNADFSRQFVNTMMDLYNVNFHPNKFESRLSYYTDLYRPLMGDADTPGTYFSRWGGPFEWKSYPFQTWVDQARSYLTNIRSAMVYNYLPTYFGSGGAGNIGISSSGLRDVTVSTTGSSAPVKINTLTVNSGWTGKYYAGNPITVEASPAPSGYTFEWVVINGTADASSASKAKISFTGNGSVQIIAKYTPSVPSGVDVIGITLNHSTYGTGSDFKTGQDFTLIATINPTGATDKTIYWTSSDNNVASVDVNGRVTAVGNGTATITATSINNKTATCSVTVTAFVDSVSLDTNTLKILVGVSVKLNADISPDNSPNKQVTWISSAPSVATVAVDGTVTAVSAGSATITVTTVDGSRTAQCSVSVKPVAQASVLLDLAAKLQTATAGAITTYQQFSDAFGDILVAASNNLEASEWNSNVEVTYAIIEEGGVKKLQVNELINFGAGLNVKDIVFEAGDRIEVKGYCINGPSSGVYVNKNCWGYDPLQGWNGGDSAFEKTFTLTAGDATSINSYEAAINGNAICLKRGGVSPWDGAIGNVGSFVIEQIKIYGYRD